MREDAMTEPMSDERLEELKRLFGRTVFDDRPWVQSAGHELIAEVERLRGIVKACADVAWEHTCKGYSENCDCSGEISQAIQALESKGKPNA